MSIAFSFPNDGTAIAVSAAKATTPRTVASDNDSDQGEEAMPWEDCDWVPMMSSGKQKTPNQIRGEFQRYLDTCGRTTKDVLEEIGVSSRSFYKFMNRKNYKDPWSAVQNQTYFEAGRFLAKHDHQKKLQKKQDKKRKASSSSDGTAVKKAKPSVAAQRAEADAWLTEVLATTGANEEVVYDSCPELVKKIKKLFQDKPGVTKAAFCRIALSGANNNALAKFLAAKHQDQQGNAVYRKAYAFFEKLRIKNGEAKTKARLKHEQEKGPEGFSIKPLNMGRPPMVFYAVDFPFF
ncbi:expressed unknown protein [Seminavis robusta]|uniref:DUF7726 domain-containing protein n=1 Tax=Seminavis robusta TaxID=568900 RepID=A0A9N8H7Q7_9STRA|nr:expressed unknown protein [Seminavis robusta]|eukprot:Sro189_g081540.1 n/a (292) ;mRNA; f:58719-59690